MPLSLTAGEDDILARLREIPGVDVIAGEYTSDSYRPKVDKATGLFQPYLTVKFHPPTAGTDPGIAQPHKDTMNASFNVFVVSPDDNLTRKLRDQVREKLLVEFRPTDGGFLRTRGGFSFVDPDLGYHRYVQSISFTYMFNLS